MPWRVLFVWEIFSKFVVSLGSAPDDDIFYESVFAVLKWKSTPHFPFFIIHHRGVVMVI